MDHAANGDDQQREQLLLRRSSEAPGIGTVRLSFTYPANDPLLTPNDGTAYSRSVRVTLH